MAHASANVDISNREADPAGQFTSLDADAPERDPAAKNRSSFQSTELVISWDSVREQRDTADHKVAVSGSDNHSNA